MAGPYAEKMKTRIHHSFKHLESNQASALIALIAAILIFSVLAAALLPMVSSSGEEAALSNLSDRAYLLAEAGYRFVKSRYSNAATEAVKNAALEAVDDGNFTLSGSQGEFQVDVYSYFFPIPDGARGTAIFTSNPPGRLPIDIAQDDDNVTIPSQALLSIDGVIYTITSASSPVSANDNVTITVDRNLVFSSGSNALPAALTNQTALVSGGTLSYAAGQGGMFPLRNGRITVGQYPNTLTYSYNDRQNNRFIDVHDPADSNMNTAWSAASTYIVLNQMTRIRSTGIVGGGDLLNRRQVDFVIAGETETGEQVPAGLGEFQATDDNATTAGVTNIGGNQALAIAQSTTNASTLQLTSATVETAMERAHRRTGGYLSYDAQVKVGFHNLLGALPSSAFTAGPIPAAASPIAVGIGFRLNDIVSATDFNGYGLSFMRADATIIPASIFSNIVPPQMSDQALLVLWQQTGEGVTWLAYKNLQTYTYPIPPSNFDDVSSAWTSSNSAVWRLEPSGGRSDSSYWRYVDNNFISATLQSPLIRLDDPQPSSPMCDGGPVITLVFWCREIIELSRSTYRQALISYNGGPFAPFNPTMGPEENGWYFYSYNLSGHAGDTIRLQLSVAPSPGIEGVQWDIDDVKVLYQHCPWPVQNSTLLVRLREAAVVEFSQGGPDEIQQGDWIYGETSGTRGRVLQPPLLTDAGWSTNSAAGTLLLNRLSINASGFQAGENLLVVGRTGSIHARVDAFDNSADRKVNIIKTYYASAAGSGSASSDPTDPDTRPYPRLQTDDPFRWPPYEDDNWTADEDYFRLVEWDAINTVAGLAYVDGSGQSVIRSYNADLQSPPLNSAVNVELGLHAFGGGADNVYFDDFGLKLYFGTSSLFDTVLQQ